MLRSKYFLTDYTNLPHATTKTAVLAVICVLWTLAGCSGSKSSPAGSDSPQTENTKSADTPQREVWDLCFVQGARVGYLHTAYYQTIEAGKPALRIEGVTQINVKRFGEDTKPRIRCTSIETPEGQLLRFESQMQMGTGSLIFTGCVVGKRLEMETVSQGKKTPGVIDWSPEYGGYFAVEQSLLKKPMQPGEERTLQTLIAGFNQLATVEMAARDWEQTPLLKGAYKLLRIDTMAIFPDGQKIEQTLWTDRTGETLKTRSLAMAMETFRATKAEAIEKSEAVQFDIGLSTIVKLEKALPGGHDTKRVVYRVHLNGGDPAATFVTGSTQSVKSLDANSAEVTVYAVRPDRPGNTAAPTDPPTAADREPNNWIQSDDPKIIALAKEAVGEETDPWLAAVKLEQFVHKYIKRKDFSQAFATAAEVAESREGDCTEHAVLLAALCRARKIPARVAIGLVYMTATQEFGYHMWTEVYIDKQAKSPLPLGEGKGEGISNLGIGPKWIPIDATLAKGGIGAAHLKLAHGSLKGASAYSSFLPVVQVVGRLKIEVVEAE